MSYNDDEWPSCDYDERFKWTDLLDKSWDSFPVMLPPLEIAAEINFWLFQIFPTLSLKRQPDVQL